MILYTRVYFYHVMLGGYHHLKQHLFGSQCIPKTWCIASIDFWNGRDCFTWWRRTTMRFFQMNESSALHHLRQHMSQFYCFIQWKTAFFPSLHSQTVSLCFCCWLTGSLHFKHVFPQMHRLFKIDPQQRQAQQKPAQQRQRENNNSVLMFRN